ncbi:hypothetical protein SBC1_28740 [Caballeronia sp. SBC1]|uniref:hypothetical protein n=1 Tax=Caballeronia sp. SBC1 TaxID=2705548 RepID=UPI00140861E0|nr:hypothetical protein [Caballeronia sp. SBC1]QIN62857.1 hypothetical protein SBC1_28740 [Caballeronia sp. SBC1]
MQVIVLGLCILLLAARLTIGIDLSDESYYAAFVDGWLKTGIAHSRNLMVHQTADFLIYPLALVFRAINGGSDGLILFLRLVYLAIAVLASTALYRAVAPRYDRPMATLVAACALIFVPFGLPAPSYNTIGMYSLLAALVLFATHFSQALPQPGKRLVLPVSLWLSAISWAFACVAYPTMLAPLLLLLVLSFLILKAKTDRSLLLRYLFACCGTLALAAMALGITFGLSRLLDMVLFTNAFNSVSGGFARKANFAASIFASHPAYAILLACALIVAVIRGSSILGRHRQWITGLATAGIVVGVVTTGSPTLFMRSHDLVLVLSVAGVGEAFRALRDSAADRGTRAFGIIYLVSFAAGITTMITAFNGPYNFPIGGLLSACLTLIPFASMGIKKSPASSQPTYRLPAGTPNLFLGAVACCAIGWSTFTFYYGQIVTPFHNLTLVREGTFKGLRTDGEQASFISELTHAINSERFCGTQMAVLGTGPGFYLMGAFAPTALSTWNFSGDAANPAAMATAAFYSQAKNRPDVLVVNTWQWATPLSDPDRALLSQYSIVQRVAVGVREATVYRREDCVAPDRE